MRDLKSIGMKPGKSSVCHGTVMEFEGASKAQPVTSKTDLMISAVKCFLRSVLVSSKDGVLSTDLQDEYKQLVGEPLPFQKLKFESLDDFVKSIPDVVERKWRAGNLYYAAVPDKTTAHIHKLVAKQKVKKTKIRKKKVILTSVPIVKPTMKTSRRKSGAASVKSIMKSGADPQSNKVKSAAVSGSNVASSGRGPRSSVVKSGVVLGSSSVKSGVVLGSTSVKSGVVLGSTSVKSGVVLGSTSVKSEAVSVSSTVTSRAGSESRVLRSRAGSGNIVTVVEVEMGSGSSAVQSDTGSLSSDLMSGADLQCPVIKSNAGSESRVLRSRAGSGNIVTVVEVEMGSGSSAVQSDTGSLSSDLMSGADLQSPVIKSNADSMTTDLKRSVRAVLVSSKDGVLANNLQGDFKRLVGSTIPYQQLKFKSLHHFLKSMPDVVKSEWRGGNLYYVAVPHKAAVHNHIPMSKLKEKGKGQRKQKNAKPEQDQNQSMQGRITAPHPTAAKAKPVLSSTNIEMLQEQLEPQSSKTISTQEDERRPIIIDCTVRKKMSSQLSTKPVKRPRKDTGGMSRSNLLSDLRAKLCTSCQHTFDDYEFHHLLEQGYRDHNESRYRYAEQYSQNEASHPRAGYYDGCGYQEYNDNLRYRQGNVNEHVYDYQDSYMYELENHYNHGYQHHYRYHGDYGYRGDCGIAYHYTYDNGYQAGHMQFKRRPMTSTPVILLPKKMPSLPVPMTKQLKTKQPAPEPTAPVANVFPACPGPKKKIKQPKTANQKRHKRAREVPLFVAPPATVAPIRGVPS